MDNLLRKIDIAIRLLQAQNKPFVSEFINSQRVSLERIYKGKPYILCTYYFPSELTGIFDVEFIYIERIVGLCKGIGMVNDLDNILISSDVCSYQKAFLYLIDNNIIPLPQRIISVNYPCFDAFYLCAYLYEKYNIPINYILQNSLEQDLKNVFSLLKNDYKVKQSISKTIKLSNQAASLKCEIDNYRIKYPGIINSGDCLKIFTVENDFGKETAIYVLRKLLDNIELNINIYTELDCSRIFWMGLIPLYNNNILSKLEQSHPVKFIFEEMWMFGNNFLSESNFFKELADKIKNSLFFNNENRAELLVSTIKMLKIDYVINFGQRNCSFLPPRFEHIRKTLNENGIKVMSVTSDVLTGNYSDSDLIALIQSKDGPECK